MQHMRSIALLVCVLAVCIPLVQSDYVVGTLSGIIFQPYYRYFCYETGLSSYPTGLDYFYYRLGPPVLFGVALALFALIAGPLFCCIRCCNCGCGCGCCGAGGSKPGGYPFSNRCCFFIFYLVILGFIAAAIVICYLGNQTANPGLQNFSSDFRTAFNNQLCFLAGSTILSDSTDVVVTPSLCTGVFRVMATADTNPLCTTIFGRVDNLNSCRRSVNQLIIDLNGTTVVTPSASFAISFDSSSINSAVKSVISAQKTVVTNTDYIAKYNPYRYWATIGILAGVAIFSLFGLWGWMCGSGCPSMTMVVLSWFGLFIIWLLFSLHFGVCIFFDDTCYQVSGWVQTGSYPRGTTSFVPSQLSDFVLCTDSVTDVDSSLRQLYGRGQCSNTATGVRDYIMQVTSAMNSQSSVTAKAPVLNYLFNATNPNVVWRNYASSSCTVSSEPTCGGSNACTAKNIMMDFQRNINEVTSWTIFVKSLQYNQGGWSVDTLVATTNLYELMLDLSTGGSCQLTKEAYLQITNGICQKTVGGIFWMFVALGVIGVAFLFLVIIGTKTYKRWNPALAKERLDEEQALYGNTVELVQIQSGPPVSGGVVQNNPVYPSENAYNSAFNERPSNGAIIYPNPYAPVNNYASVPLAPPPLHQSPSYVHSSSSQQQSSTMNDTPSYAAAPLPAYPAHAVPSHLESPLPTAPPAHDY